MLFQSEVRSIVASHCPPGAPADRNLEALRNDLKHIGVELPDGAASLVDDEELQAAVRDAAASALAAKEREVDAAIWPQILGAVILRSIDQLWVEHLTEVDDLRRGIGLRGYAQEDPLNAFKKEAFTLYDELQGLIRSSIGRSILRVTVVQEPPAPRPVTLHAGSAATAERTTAAQPAAPRIPTGSPTAKAGRNELCPCGSGKKFKRCHGA